MVASTPVEIGTRGTIGSLVRKEIEYFTKIELDRRVSSGKPQEQMTDMDSSSTGHSMPCFWSLTLNWKRKKRRGNNSGFFPSIFSSVKVAETDPLNGIPGFSYRILKNDEKDNV